jgi:hypothetical protein
LSTRSDSALKPTKTSMLKLHSQLKFFILRTNLTVSGPESRPYELPLGLSRVPEVTIAYLLSIFKSLPVSRPLLVGAIN